MDAFHGVLIGLLAVAAAERLFAAVAHRAERREWAKERQALTKALIPRVDFTPDAPPVRLDRMREDPDEEVNGW